jgi:hypothetical protein
MSNDEIKKTLNHKKNYKHKIIIKFEEKNWESGVLSIEALNWKEK